MCGLIQTFYSVYGIFFWTLRGGIFFNDMLGWMSLITEGKSNQQRAATGQWNPNNSSRSALIRRKKIFIHAFYKCDLIWATLVFRTHTHRGDVCKSRVNVALLSQPWQTWRHAVIFMAGRQRLLPLDRLSSTEAWIILPLQELRSVSGSSGGGLLWRWRQRALQFLCVGADHLQAEMKGR